MRVTRQGVADLDNYTGVDLAVTNRNRLYRQKMRSARKAQAKRLRGLGEHTLSKYVQIAGNSRVMTIRRDLVTWI